MNQILMMNNSQEKNKVKSKKSSGEPLETGAVVKLFAVIIIIFGIIISGNGVYAMLQDINEKKNAVTPTVTTTKQGSEVVIDVSTSAGIRTVAYAWNGGSSVSTSGQNKTQISFSTSIPFGSSKLEILVTDSKGHQTRYVKNYIQENEDTEKPTIDFETEGNNIKIIITDNVALDTVKYKIGNDEEKEVQAEENQDTLEILVPIDRGQITINIEATDTAGNVEKVNQEVKGATKPTIEVTADPSDLSYLIIKAHDVEGLRMITFYINDQQYQTDPNVSLNTTDFEFRVQVQRGENRVKVHAYNVNEQVSEFDGIYNY